MVQMWIVSILLLLLLFVCSCVCMCEWFSPISSLYFLACCIMLHQIMKDQALNELIVRKSHRLLFSARFVRLINLYENAFNKMPGMHTWLSLQCTRFGNWFIAVSFLLWSLLFQFYSFFPHFRLELIFTFRFLSKQQKKIRPKKYSSQVNIELYYLNRLNTWNARWKICRFCIFIFNWHKRFCVQWWLRTKQKQKRAKKKPFTFVRKIHHFVVRFAFTSTSLSRQFIVYCPRHFSLSV